MREKTKKRSTAVFFAVVLAAFVFIRFALYDGLTVRTYTIDSPHTDSEHTFVLLTDLHSTLYGDGQTELIDAIRELSPEAVFLVGDIGDDKRDFDGTAVLLEALTEEYKCYYMTGNHERWVGYTDDIKSLVGSYGVEVLAGESVMLGDGIVLHGIDDPLFYGSESEFSSALSELSVSDDTFDILLSHRPEYAEQYAELGFDLTLSGHAHGGQIRIPLIVNGLYAPNQGFLPEWAGGQYTVGDATLIVSRGLMKNELPRVFNPPELVVVRIK